MRLEFGPGKLVRISDARIIWKNFAGEAKHYYMKGQYGFTLLIPDLETAEALQNDKNKYGVGWNVSIKDGNEDSDPFMKLKVKINHDGPRPIDIYLDVNGKVTKLDKESSAMIDDISIRSVDLDISPNDGEGTFGPYRTAYLRAIWVYQEVDRFADRYDRRARDIEDDYYGE